VLTALPGAICRTCATSFGLLEAPFESPRRRRPCARCGHSVLVEALVRERAAAGAVAPLAATFERKLKTPILTGEEDVEYDAVPDHAAPRGLFVATICRGCGFTEWYALDPHTIPIGPAYGTRLIEIEQTPYR
jgi:hypothetical protein